ncbi:MAG: FeoB-associated Cys-rich membrane protein [Butyrivibrio sp.]|nr:FeoB-associated Cys-rich membrane protein [Acetatifactor muris]MCM1560670.1 FeoB-associated Cys-rich membrane protein [Butyrivibrio sp.]
MENFIIVVILLCIIGSIIFYLYRAKKRGETCIGCPYAKQCGSGQCGGSCKGQCGETGEKKL